MPVIVAVMLLLLLLLPASWVAAGVSAELGVRIHDVAVTGVLLLLLLIIIIIIVVVVHYCFSCRLLLRLLLMVALFHHFSSFAAQESVFVDENDELLCWLDGTRPNGKH